MSRSFSAWALPSSVQAAVLSTVSLDGGRGAGEDGDIRVEYPAGAPDWIASVVDALVVSRSSLVRRSAEGIAGLLGAVGFRFMSPGDPIREEALRLLPGTAGVSAEMAETILDGMAADWTPARLAALLGEEFGAPGMLDEFTEGKGQRSMPVGPRLTAQFVSGSVPGVSVNALIRALLVKSPTLVKPGLGDVVLPVLFVRALREADAALADAVAVVYWPGGSVSSEDIVLGRAEMVTAYGGDDTVAALRARVPVSTRFRAYHHRTSIGVVGRGALGPAAVSTTTDDLARAVAVFDQRGCVSPQVVFVEEGGEMSPAAFADALAVSFEALEDDLPGGALDAAEASTLQQLRGTAEMMGAAGSGVECTHGGTASWTVIFDPDAQLASACVGRVVRVRPILSAQDLPAVLEPVAAHLQTVGVAGLGQNLDGLAERLGRLGASRVVPFAQVPFPPAWWHHDGGGPLRDLVRYIDLSS